MSSILHMEKKMVTCFWIESVTMKGNCLILRGTLNHKINPAKEILWLQLGKSMFRGFNDEQNREFIVTISLQAEHQGLLTGAIYKGKTTEAIRVCFGEADGLPAGSYQNGYCIRKGTKEWILAKKDGGIFIEPFEQEAVLSYEALLEQEIRTLAGNPLKGMLAVRKHRKEADAYLKRGEKFNFHEESEDDQSPLSVVSRSHREAVSRELIPVLQEKELWNEKRNITDLCFDEPLDEKAIVMIGLGHNVRGNLQYILNELNFSPEFAGFRIYVRTDAQTDEIVQGYINQNGWERTKTVLKNRTYSRLMESAKYMLTEIHFPEGWIKKPGQVVINIWHGTPLKKLGLSKNSKDLHREGNTQKNFINSDYLLYPNAYTRDHMLESFRISELLKGKIAMLGYPRTGGMLSAADKDLTSVRELLAPRGEHIYAYMPTWKDYLESEQVVEACRKFLDYMDEHLRDDQIFYVNLHHRVSDSLDYGIYRHIKPFPPLLDTYELLAATEALVTDYSSVFYDYLASRKQIILFCPDYEEYRSLRGVYEDLMELPFDKAETAGDVIEAINRGKTYDDEAAFGRFNAWDSRDNAHKLCGLFLKKEEEVEILPVPVNEVPKVMVYSEQCEAGKLTDLLYGVLAEGQPAEMAVYLGCDIDKVDEHIDSAYPLLAKTACFGTKTNTHLSTLGRGALALYQAGELTFDQMMRYAAYDFALDHRRMFGDAEFDRMIIYDVQDPEKILALSMAAKEMVLVISPEHIKKIQDGNFYLRDAISYAAGRALAVFAPEPNVKEQAEGVLPLHISDIGLLDEKILAQLIKEAHF